MNFFFGGGRAEMRRFETRRCSWTSVVSGYMLSANKICRSECIGKVKRELLTAVHIKVICTIIEILSTHKLLEKLRSSIASSTFIEKE